MCFLQIQGVQVCGIKRVIIQTTDFLQIKAYTVKKANNVFSFALCGLIFCWLVLFLTVHLCSHISPQMVNSIWYFKNKRTKSGIYHCCSQLWSELSPLSRCPAFSEGLWDVMAVWKKEIKPVELLLIWLQNVARLWKYTSFHTLFPE